MPCSTLSAEDQQTFSQLMPPSLVASAPMGPKLCAPAGALRS